MGQTIDRQAKQQNQLGKWAAKKSKNIDYGNLDEWKLKRKLLILILITISNIGNQNAFRCELHLSENVHCVIRFESPLSQSISRGRFICPPHSSTDFNNNDWRWG